MNIHDIKFIEGISRYEDGDITYDKLIELAYLCVKNGEHIVTKNWAFGFLN